MTGTDAQRTYRIIIVVLAAIILVALALAVLAWALTRPPPAVPAPIPAQPATWTPIPTLAGVTEELLVCQREAVLAMNARQMIGAANLADDGQLRLRWVSLDRAVEDLDDALPGVILGLDVAAELWQEGCALYDRASVEVYDRRGERQVRRLTVQARMDDVLRWQAGELPDSELLERLEVTGEAED